LRVDSSGVEQPVVLLLLIIESPLAFEEVPARYEAEELLEVADKEENGADSFKEWDGGLSPSDHVEEEIQQLAHLHRTFERTLRWCSRFSRL
ncbi:hypothetical protein PENTCL1PPCAC_28524, partial [Pristionchus entomophagus]